jgi:transposase
LVQPETDVRIVPKKRASLLDPFKRLTCAEQADLSGINRFVNGVTSDLDPVTAGLSLPYSSGPVASNVNQIKMLKRQMYGRTSFDLLRKRVLLA